MYISFHIFSKNTFERIRIEERSTLDRIHNRKIPTSMPQGSSPANYIKIKAAVTLLIWVFPQAIHLIGIAARERFFCR